MGNKITTEATGRFSKIAYLASLAPWEEMTLVLAVSPLPALDGFRSLFQGLKFLCLPHLKQLKQLVSPPLSLSPSVHPTSGVETHSL